MKKVSVYPSFASLPSPYPALFAEAACASGFFFSLPWFSHLAATTLQDQSLRLYAVESQTPTLRPELLLPMYHSRAPAKFFAARRLHAAANFYTSLFGPVTSEVDANLRSSLVLLANAIAAKRPGWDIVDIHPLAADSPAYEMLAVALRQAGFAVQRYFCFGNWYLPVQGRTYQQYFDTLPSKLKNTLMRKSRRLAKSHELRIKIITDEADVEEGMAAYQQVYQSSWKPAEAFPDFMPGLIQLCAQQGWLRLGIAYIDGQPAAAQLWIVSHRIASIYKLAYDNRFAELSIGSILTANLMQHVIDIDRVSEVDYLTGDDAYKRDWMSHRRERSGIIGFNLRSVYGMLAAIRHIGGRTLKSLLQR